MPFVGTDISMVTRWISMDKTKRSSEPIWYQKGLREHKQVESGVAREKQKQSALPLQESMVAYRRIQTSISNFGMMSSSNGKKGRSAHPTVYEAKSTKMIISELHLSTLFTWLLITNYLYLCISIYNPISSPPYGRVLNSCFMCTSDNGFPNIYNRAYKSISSLQYCNLSNLCTMEHLQYWTRQNIESIC